MLRIASRSSTIPLIIREIPTDVAKTPMIRPTAIKPSMVYIMRLIGSVALASGTMTPSSQPVLPTGKSAVITVSPPRASDLIFPSLPAAARSKPGNTSEIFFNPESLAGCAMTSPSLAIRKA